MNRPIPASSECSFSKEEHPSHSPATSVVKVRLPRSDEYGYDIRIARNIADRAGKELASCLSPCRAVLLTDDQVGPLYAGRIEASLAEAGFPVFRHVIPHGESSKTEVFLFHLLQHMAQENLTRSDCLVALGGGVVGDLGGLAAALYRRGIPLVQIPTSLLAMADASVGGKNAVNLPCGKNLVGTFHQPSLVLCDPDFLDTLPTEELADGFAEIVKYALLRDHELYRLLRDHPLEHMEEILRLSVEDKRDLVVKDETDRGERQLLNLGHTVGHAIELCSHFRISHGHAVSVGMVIMTRAAESLGICESGTCDKLCELLAYFNLPVSCPFTAEQLSFAAQSDKKHDGNFLTLAVPHAMCDTRLITIPADALESYIRRGLCHPD